MMIMMMMMMMMMSHTLLDRKAPPLTCLLSLGLVLSSDFFMSADRRGLSKLSLGLQTTTFEEKRGAEGRRGEVNSNLRPSVYQPSASPLSHNDSQTVSGTAAPLSFMMHSTSRTGGNA